MESLKDKTITAFFWRLFERGGNQCVALIVQIVMARLLAPSDFGLLAIVLVIVNIGNIVVVSGLGNSLVQTQNIDGRDYSTVFWITLSLSIGMYLAVFSVAPYISKLYDATELTGTLRALGVLFPLCAVESVQMAFAQRDLEFKVLFNATIASTIISGCAGIALAFAGAGLWSLVSQQIIYHLVNCLTLCFQTKWAPSFTFDKHAARKHFSFGWKIMLPSLMETAYDSASDLIVGKQFGSTSLGFLSQGKKYPVALDSMVSGTLQPVLLASISRAQTNTSSVKSIAKRALKTSFFFVAPIMCCLALVANPTIELLLGEQWLPATPFLQLFCISSMLSSFHTINYETFNGIGRSDVFLKVKSITVSYGIVFLLIASFFVKDVMAVVVAYALSSIISTAVNAHPNKRLIGYPYAEQLRDIAPSILSSLVSFGIAYPIAGLELGSLPTLLLQASAFLLAYMLLSSIVNREQVGFLRNELLSRFS